MMRVEKIRKGRALCLSSRVARTFFLTLVGFGLIFTVPSRGEELPEVKAVGASTGFTHVVQEKQFLWEVSLLYYGSLKKVPEIAQWNQLEPPYRLRRGQRLVLRLQPTVPLEVGRSWVLEYWRQYLDARGARPKGGSILFQFKPPRQLDPSQASPLWLKVTPSSRGSGSGSSKLDRPRAEESKDSVRQEPSVSPRKTSPVRHEIYSADEDGTLQEDHVEMPMKIEEVPGPTSNPQ